MGKMVLFLADGSTLDIPLDKARITVGRRSGNDVCLPYAPVSAEHALFVIVPTGVVVEDLGSTNGTIVNGKRVARQFLHDGDRVEIGRQKFIYLANAEAVVEPVEGAPAVARRRHSDRLQAVEGDVAAVASPAASGALATPIGGQPIPPVEAVAPLPADELADTVVVQTEAAPNSWDAGAYRGAVADDYMAMAASHGITFDTPTSIAPAPPPARTEESAPGGPHLRVVSGPSAGRFLALTKNESLLGRVGVQVVAIRRGDDGYRIAAAEGSPTLDINGVSRSITEGFALASGDVIAIAGARLELVVPTESPAV
jgi:pSer/pThr/pTyr-binding forkhead associated (FHA) protein